MNYTRRRGYLCFSKKKHQQKNVFLALHLCTFTRAAYDITVKATVKSGLVVGHRSFDVEKHLLSKKIDAHDDDMMHVHLYSQQKKS